MQHYGNEGHYNDYAKLYSIVTILLPVVRPPVLFKPVQRAHSVFVCKKTPELIMEYVGFNGEFKPVVFPQSSEPV
jgi:hypothetical protein